MKAFALKEWLQRHSSKADVTEDELVFTHFSGETSILLPRNRWHDGILQVDMEPLREFYDEYYGASIGNSHLTFATNIRGGIDVSHGFRLMDFNEMASQARSLGVNIAPGETVFLAEAGFMFIYACGVEAGKPFLRKYDRDFSKSKVVRDLDQVLDSWWRMVREDHDQN